MPCDRPVDRAGTFRAQIREYGLFEADSGAVAINVVCDLLEMWNGEGWDDWREYAQDAEGAVWIFKKDGTANEKAIDSLCQHAGWNGDVDAITNEKWVPELCQVVIKLDNYNNVDRYRVSFINGYNSTPGGALSNVTPEKAKVLKERFGSTLRAIAGNAKLNAPKNGSKKPPPTPKPKTTAYSAPADPANKALAEAAAGQVEDIPFSLLPFLVACGLSASQLV